MKDYTLSSSSKRATVAAVDDNDSGSYDSNDSRGGLTYNTEFNCIFKVNTASLWK